MIDGRTIGLLVTIAVLLSGNVAQAAGMLARLGGSRVTSAIQAGAGGFAATLVLTLAVMTFIIRR